jgi:hypothetical protein
MVQRRGARRNAVVFRVRRYVARCELRRTCYEWRSCRIASIIRCVR